MLEILIHIIFYVLFFFSLNSYLSKLIIRRKKKREQKYFLICYNFPDNANFEFNMSNVDFLELNQDTEYIECATIGLIREYLARKVNFFL